MPIIFYCPWLKTDQAEPACCVNFQVLLHLCAQRFNDEPFVGGEQLLTEEKQKALSAKHQRQNRLKSELDSKQTLCHSARQTGNKHSGQSLQQEDFHISTIASDGGAAD